MGKDVLWFVKNLITQKHWHGIYNNSFFHSVYKEMFLICLIWLYSVLYLSLQGHRYICSRDHWGISRSHRPQNCQQIQHNTLKCLGWSCQRVQTCNLLWKIWLVCEVHWWCRLLGRRDRHGWSKAGISHTPDESVAVSTHFWRTPRESVLGVQRYRFVRPALA